MNIRENTKNAGLKAIVREWLDALALAAVILTVLFFFCWPFQVQGLSMSETLRDNDRIVVSRLSALTDSFSRGDLAVCRILDSSREEIVVKRIVGLPGDHVFIEGGRLFLNGRLAEEPYLLQTVNAETGTANIMETEGEVDILLAHDEYFVMGDNRALSFDSRVVGPVNRQAVVGRVFARWWPVENFAFYRSGHWDI